MFETSNIVNTLPDSRYIVKPDSVVRMGFINAGPGRRDRGGNLVSRHDAICYLEPGSRLEAAVRHAHSPDISIQYVDGDVICLKVNGRAGSTVGFAYRVPRDGLMTMDFKWIPAQAGRIERLHHGHAVKNILFGAPAPEQNPDAMAQEVWLQVKAKRLMQGDLMGHPPALKHVQGRF
jgi:hypothetical protein